ncbi:BppU family phage baseplate upper protein [Tetragenococcus halophilus]|uniref:BppU family phage baseplate upper protein n=1 Tax=Tetragenococcus halophilus TaxID=51669 RepID=UPI00209AC12F|nr:BppU family phage baseplate upper protein [Tetragenococcus halophilus]MCO8294915.1 BppU family phage baseplate upper protein [Tetragenococcus halophilus]
MPVLKKGEIKARATAYGTEVKSTGYVFYSYDKNSSALFFQFRNQNGETTDIANAKIRLLLIKNDDEDKEFIPSQEDFEIISKLGGKAKFVLPEMLLAYQGKVTGYIYLDFEDGSQTDEGQFTFRIRRSMITHVLPEAGDKYVQDFEDVKERVEQAGDSATKDIKQAKDDAESQIGEYVGEVESAKDSAVEDIDQALLVDEAKKYTDSQMNSLKQESVTLNVPTDFPTLDSAFHEIESNFYALRASVYVNIEAGHQISEGVVLKSRDYRRVTIQSEDDIVEVADGFTGDILKGSDCHFPIFNLLVDMKKLGSFGLGLYANANATVNPDCGVINAGNDGVFVNRLSQLYAHEANFSGAGRYGLFVDHANTVYARYVNLDNCEVGLRATKGSVVEVANASIQNCRNAILATEGSKVIGITDPSEPNRHLDVSGSTGNAIDLTNGAEFVADKVIIEDCGTGIVARSGSKVVCSGTGIVNCGEAMKLSKQSTAYMGDFYMNDITETGVSLSEGAFLQAESSECHVDNDTFRVKNGSSVNLDGSDLTNCGTPVKCSEGSHANCYNVDATGHTANYGFYVYYGSTINAVEALGDLRVTANTITSDGYIIQ